MNLQSIDVASFSLAAEAASFGVNMLKFYTLSLFDNKPQGVIYIMNTPPNLWYNSV